MAKLTKSKIEALVIRERDYFVWGLISLREQFA